MINRSALLSDLQKLLKRLEADLLERSESADVPAVGETLRAEYEQARQAERTAQNYEDWRNDAITQAAAAWVLSAVFVRFLEDNRLIEPPRFSGPGDQLQRARDERELYFRTHPTETDREYLLAVFDELATLPGTREVFSEHNPLRELPQWLSGDAAGELLDFFQKIDANAGGLVHDFTDADWDTRFLGDLYQDLSEAARKKYALLQTPEFVEEFILDRTLEPALDEFGLDAPPVNDPQGHPVTQAGFRMIDPACGSGHFLLGTFPRLLDRWFRQQPGGKVRDLVQKTLDSIHGVDVNPYAIAIARFRLLLKAMQACDIHQLKNAPAFTLHLACGDSLLHSPLRGGQQVFDFELTSDDAECEHAYQSEDLPALKQTLRSGIYHAVVANPPYITVKDKQLNQRYRSRFKSCHRQYSLAVPFMERIFQLAAEGGFTGQITANSFMKREFGKKLIEQFLPQIDLTHVIDTSGAYIPGHGTPTVILFGRHRKPVTSTIRTVMGIRGEPSTPKNPAQGFVWSAIVNQIDHVDSESEFMSVADSDRELFHKHPWSITGGGASELKEIIENRTSSELQNLISEIGASVVTREDDVYQTGKSTLSRKRISTFQSRALIDGEHVRDWAIDGFELGIWPYNPETFNPFEDQEQHRYLWPYRSGLSSRIAFGKSQIEHGKTWYEYSMFFKDRLSGNFRIGQAEVATHNHFALDRGDKVFKQTAPVIKLSEEASEDDHLTLLGLLNSSTVGFWMKQVCHQKQMMGGDGIRIESKAKVPYAFNATAVGKLPIPESWTKGALRDRLLDLTQEMDQATMKFSNLKAETVLSADNLTKDSLLKTWEENQHQRQKLRSRQIFLQEQIDFTVYRMFDLIPDRLIGEETDQIDFDLTAGARPFCIRAGKNEDGFDVPASVPEDWPEEIQALWNARLKELESNKSLRLIESSMYKRRWIGRQGLFNHQRSDNELLDAAKNWLLDRLERYFDFDGRMNPEGTPTAEVDIQLISIAQLADIAGRDPQFLEVGAVYRDDDAFDVQRLIAELVHAEQVPLLPILRYKPAGLRKRAEWEQTWELQRREDAIDARTQLPEDDPQYLTEAAARDLKQAEVGDIPVPPKYKSSDFFSTGGVRYWALRGKLDVPKERWISFPHCEGPDGTPVIAWAGYDHLQLARAISAYFVEVQEQFGGRDDPRLIPLLACQIELLPWLKQWHHDLDPEFNQRMDEVFAGFITAEAKALEMTSAEIKNWQPPKKVSKAKRKAGK
ncbi:BREX-2 system adenine-specific DNA-methyltransferase PglX [Gimesia maris]|uniref:site-specific DNA-methyltransferase (adenine-specific) n=1 Tax=Gimesia maris TaxID=122 RepID=A0ABX5YRM4_9PLAN|nr:BREX-2 system adenine-specific DNA-methyltransferase PglX [Gimesia maris]EDL59261.1 putative DNA methylase [Gimesia maris DSM 8797]QEG18202.1 Modification methylase PaeR7I [Gimesia maris]QGQ28795.1 BREX-2 system adenine-specific DNA-methyltransferase PglX [Gimesia maris]